jgi:predicted nucleotidyltransferase
MLLEQLRAKRQAIETLGQKFGAKRIGVFGSVARGEESDRSDIDFLVEFPRGYDLFQQRIPLTEELSLLLGRPADIVPEHELSPHIRARVIVEAVEL